jgi:hypothetical protein
MTNNNMNPTSTYSKHTVGVTLTATVAIIPDLLGIEVCRSLVRRHAGWIEGGQSAKGAFVVDLLTPAIENNICTTLEKLSVHTPHPTLDQHAAAQITASIY